MRDFKNFIIAFLLTFATINACIAKKDTEDIKAQVAELQAAFTKQD